MSTIHTALSGLQTLDALAYRDSIVHRLDPRAKILVTAVFVCTVMSFSPYALVSLSPFFAFPAFLIVLGGIPLRDLVVRLAIASPFAVIVGAFNPLLDKTPVAVCGVLIDGGWISFASILIRFCLTVSAALLVVYTTGMYRLCMGLQRLGVPVVMAMQLLFLYRYIFVLAEEASRMFRARQLRNMTHGRVGMRAFGQMAGLLFVRTLDRAERIHQAMISRGFSGEIRLAGELRFKGRDMAFVVGWIVFFVCMRMFDIVNGVGSILTGLVQ